MIKAAITGNIASGKSCVEEYIKEAGFKVIDADKINHEILSSDNKVIKEVKEAFKNDDILAQNGSISREKLGVVVFSDSIKKQMLENILYPRIQEKINLFIEANKKEKNIFVSVPMLFESGIDKYFDKIIFVYAPDDIRLQRLIQRNNYSPEYAKKRLDAQECQEIKMDKSDYIIYNDSDLEHLKQQIHSILAELINQ